MEYEDLREVEKEVVFEASGTFDAIDKARTYLSLRKYSIGSMCRNEPMGFAKGEVDIAKWRNIHPSEYDRLSGIIISDDFREGGCKILFWKKES